VTYGEPHSITHDELIERHPQKLRAVLSHLGVQNVDPSDYQVANISPYKIHQCLAQSVRIGRILLAGDSAHLCNPFGGLGLSGGIVDVGGLVDCLIGMHEGAAGEDILDRYSEVRREKYEKLVNPTSSHNFERLFDQDPETAL